MIILQSKAKEDGPSKQVDELDSYQGELCSMILKTSHPAPNESCTQQVKVNNFLSSHPNSMIESLIEC